MTDTTIHGCSGKKAFATMTSAKKHAKWMRRKYDEPLAAYHCKHCRMFHIGGTE